MRPWGLESIPSHLSHRYRRWTARLIRLTFVLSALVVSLVVVTGTRDSYNSVIVNITYINPY